MKQEKKKESREQEYLDGWKRARADLENMKKRMADTLESQQGAMKKDIAYSLVALADNFRSLADHVPNASDPWAAGVLHVARQFEQTLSEFGVEVITDIGKEFNPALHEAIEEIEKEGEKPGTIVELVRAGYKIGPNVIRPAKVKVAAKLPSPTEIGDPGDDTN